MTQQQVDRRNYDVVSISRPGREDRASFVQDALHIERSKTQTTGGQFIKVFANMILTKTGGKSYF